MNRQLARPAARRGQAPIDRWSWVHLASGIALAVLFGGWLLPLALLVAFEVAESVLRRVPSKAGGLAEFESWGNVVADVVVGMGGVVAVRILWPGSGLWLGWPA